MCLAGTHPTYIDSFSNVYYDSKKCAICSKTSKEKNKKGDWLMHFCKQCNQCYCYDCYGYPFQEIIACKEGHHMQYNEEPVQSSCIICDKCEKNIRWECSDKNCYRYKICSDCINPITATTIDQKLVYQIKEPPKPKINPFKLRVCLKGQHPIYVDTFGNAYYDSKKCAICKQKSTQKTQKGDNDCLKPISATSIDISKVYEVNKPEPKKEVSFKPRMCRQNKHPTYLANISSSIYDSIRCKVCGQKAKEKTVKGAWLMHKCQQCDEYYCFECHGYPFQELVACKEGHQMKFNPDPVKNWCTFCDTCDNKIQWECSEKNCYRYKLCTNCLKPISATSITANEVYKQMVPPLQQKYKLKLCLNNAHPTFVKALTSSQKDANKCKKCNGVSQVQNKKGQWMIHYCKQCDQYICYGCYGQPCLEIMACDKGHHMNYFTDPIRKYCKICDQCDNNIYWECLDSGCGQYKVCSNCVKPVSINQK
eukprot:TRINITY_DN51_c0_g1_i6.p1 TRINITY_DN51_c0_g1~~TRINITY_DN51_c0_g1_i6.p1  ORF type:complete len:479 (-),score=57.19 TRINITY_DN51_c0_g1_i6:301-1737(-)